MRINAGYIIIYSSKVTDDTEIVLGYHPITEMYVTWVCCDGNNYFWGHYFQNESVALIDLSERIEGAKN